MKRSLKTAIVVLSLLVFVFFNAPAFAEETGKIAGWVIDKETGIELPGATVRIEGTNFANMAGPDGSYFIINIPPGIYTLTASLIGYESIMVQDIEVISNRTREVNFKLKPFPPPPRYTDLKVVIRCLEESQDVIDDDVFKKHNPFFEQMADSMKFYQEAKILIISQIDLIEKDKYRGLDGVDLAFKRAGVLRKYLVEKFNVDECCVILQARGVRNIGSEYRKLIVKIVDKVIEENVWTE